MVNPSILLLICDPIGNDSLALAGHHMAHSSFVCDHHRPERPGRIVDGIVAPLQLIVWA